MKKLFFFCLSAILSSRGATAQVSVGNDALILIANTPASFDGLTLNSSSDLTVSNNVLSISTTAIPGSPPSITRVYKFSSPITFEGTVGLFYQTSELNGNVEGNLKIVYANGSPSVTTTGGTVDAVNNYISNELSSPVTFNTVTAATAGALPVTLAYFTVKKEVTAAQISWETSSETNSDFFEVQRSSDAKSWQVLGKVFAQSDSRTANSYFYTDSNPLRSSNFYRLKMVDRDGSFTYSSMRTLQFDGDVAVISYPNPATEKILIAPQSGNVSLLKLLNVQGRVLYESGEGQTVREMDVKKYPSGMYFLEVLQSDGSVKLIKFIKQ